jgi:cell shape-determining protein MreC
MNLPKISRKQAGVTLSVSQRQIQRYIRFGFEVLGVFENFFNAQSEELNGFPLTEKELAELTKIQQLIRKYKNVRNSHQQIKKEFDSEQCTSDNFNP